RFIEVDRERNVDPPTREKTEDANLKPDHQAREAHDKSAPDDRPVFGFFSVAKPRYLWFDATQAEIVSKVAEHVLHIFWARQHVLHPLAAVPGECQVAKMINANDQHDDR